MYSKCGLGTPGRGPGTRDLQITPPAEEEEESGDEGDNLSISSICGYQSLRQLNNSVMAGPFGRPIAKGHSILIQYRFC